MRSLTSFRGLPVRSTTGLALLLVIFLPGCGFLGTDEAAPPAAPEDVTVTASQSEVTLSWEGNSDAKGYNVYRSEESMPTDLSGATPANGSTPIEGETFADVAVDNSTTYFYRVTAVNDDGESSPSAVVKVTTPYPEPPGRP